MKQLADTEWPIKPPDHLWVEMTAEEVLDNWRERIERVAFEESDHLVALPYVKGIAVIGPAFTGRRCLPFAVNGENDL